MTGYAHFWHPFRTNDMRHLARRNNFPARSTGGAITDVLLNVLFACDPSYNMFTEHVS